MLCSFIIPYYNGQNTVRHCLNSILKINLSPKIWEIIIVDDDSPTSAEFVLQDYIKNYSNIYIVRHKSNKRQGGAKNTGMALAKGHYIIFADQDDFIIPQNMKTALLLAQSTNVDMLVCHYNICTENGAILDNGIKDGNNMIVSGKEFCELFFQPSYNLAPWANLYKRDFLEKTGHPFEENVLMEDSDWIAWHYIHAEKVGIFNRPIYTWVMNPSSITHSLKYPMRADFIKMGYRKIRDTHFYQKSSSSFAITMKNDGRSNIIGGMKKMWKVDNYSKFYNYLGETLILLQKMDWSGVTKLHIQHPKLTLAYLYTFGIFLKLLNHAKHKLFN